MRSILHGKDLTNAVVVDLINEGRKSAIDKGATPDASLEKLLDIYSVRFEALFRNTRDKIDATLERSGNPTPEKVEIAQCSRMQIMIKTLAFEIHTARLLRKQEIRLQAEEARTFREELRGRSNSFKNELVDKEVGFLPEKERNAARKHMLRLYEDTESGNFTMNSFYEHVTGQKHHKVTFQRILEAKTAAMHMQAEMGFVNIALRAFMNPRVDTMRTFVMPNVIQVEDSASTEILTPLAPPLAHAAVPRPNPDTLHC